MQPKANGPEERAAAQSRSRKGVAVRPVRNSGELSDVKQLWRASSDTLGFFPDGAFVEHMQRGWILGAFSPTQRCLGYLAFRISRGNAVIVHLCVSPDARNQGVGRALVEGLRAATLGCQGAILKCRTDYEANKMWPQLGFVTVAETKGKSVDGRILNTWWFDYGEPNLFSPAHDERRVTVLDANVFYDLQDALTPQNIESKALTADWVQEYVQLAITDEMYTEIARNPDRAERDRRRAFVGAMRRIQHDHDLARRIENELKDVMPSDGHASTESDRLQLAKAIAGEADAFITRDERILNLARVIQQRYGLRVVRPLEAIIEVDQLQRATKYEPVRLSGTLLTTRLIKNDDIESLARKFQNYTLREPLGHFVAVIRTALAKPTLYECRLVESADGDSLGLEVVEHASNERQVRMLRLRGPTAETLARHMVWRQLTEAARSRQEGVHCSDAFLQGPTVDALVESGFVRVIGGWGKAAIRGLLSPEDVDARLRSLEQTVEWMREVRSEVRQLLTRPIQPIAAAVLERTLWPLRLSIDCLPTFIVPIEPQWALHLFDERLAEQVLFGSDPSLALNVYNVYYRAARPKILTAPGRLLWYVSKRHAYPGSGQIRAVSSLDDVSIGPAKQLFARFKRFGVFKWKDVAMRCREGPQSEIMAFSFSGTELFPRPIAWSALQDALQLHRGRTCQLQSPIEIDLALFQHLYLIGGL